MRSSFGCLRRSVASSFISSASALPELSAAISGFVPGATYSGSPRPRMMLVCSKTNCVWLSGIPIMSQMIPSGSGAAMSRTKSHSPLSITASTSSAGAPLDVALELRERARREAARHDAAQPRVARIVHRDHRAEELVQLRRQIGNVDALARAEEIAAPARRHHVGVARHRPVARPLRQRDLRRRLELLVERHRPLAAQQREGALALLAAGRSRTRAGRGGSSSTLAGSFGSNMCRASRRAREGAGNLPKPGRPRPAAAGLPRGAGLPTLRRGPGWRNWQTRWP